MAELLRSGPDLLENRLMRVEVERRIDAPLASVWNIISDYSTRSSWYPANDEFVPLGSADREVGAVFAEREWVWKATVEIVEWDEGSRIGFATTSLNFPGLLRELYTEVSIEPHDEQTTVHIRGAFRFGLVGWLLFPYTYPQMTGTLWVDYRRSLKALEAMLARDDV